MGVVTGGDCVFTCVTTRFEFRTLGNADVAADCIVLLLTWLTVGAGVCRCAGMSRDTLFCRGQSVEFVAVGLTNAVRAGVSESAVVSMLRPVKLCAELTEAETKAVLAGTEGELVTRTTGDVAFAGSRIVDLATDNVLAKADRGITVTPCGNRPLPGVI